MNVFKTRILEEDLDPINEVLRSGDLGFGSNVGRVEIEFEKFSEKSCNIATNSASAAAFMIFAWLREQYGHCDVYTPSIGFTSPAWAARHFGHRLIFVDVDENLLFSMDDYRRKRKDIWSSNVPVIMPILYGGVSTIPNFKRVDEVVVVDSAHCVTPTIESDFTFFSFHTYKPLACSDGGMISTDDHAAEQFFYTYRNFGRFPAPEGYDIVQEGFKFYMNNLNAAILLTQMERYEETLSERKINFGVIADLPLQGRLLPHDEHSSYYFGTLIANPDAYDTLKDLYRTAKHYPMLHKTKYFKQNLGAGRKPWDTSLPNTEKLHPYIINIPLYNEAQI